MCPRPAAVNKRKLHCDFSSLAEGVELANVNQSSLLETSCLLFVTGADMANRAPRSISVVNMSTIDQNYYYYDNKLGHDNEHSSSVLGQTALLSMKSVWRSFSSLFFQQPKALILQPMATKDIYKENMENTATTTTASSSGCMNFQFVDPVDLTGMEILGVPEEGSITITIVDADGIESVIVNPEHVSVGMQSSWLIHKTHSKTFQTNNAVLLSICSPIASAITFIDFMI